MIETLFHIAIIGSSDKTVRFYNKLGFVEDSRLYRPDHNDTIVWMKGFGLYLELFLKQDHAARETKTYGLNHLAFLVNDFDKMVEDLKEYNPGEIIVGRTGMRTCFVNDPDGTIIELKEKL